MITEGDKVKILDFGLAKALSNETQSVDSSQSPTLTFTEGTTRPGVILGTAAYMSPEQAQGAAVDKRTDIWAFGCVLYECLTGRKAFEGKTVTETLAAILKVEPDWQALPASIPPRVRFVLRRCLEKESVRRLHHAADVRIQIEEEEDTGEMIVPKKRSWLSWGVAAVLAAALGISLWAPWRAKPAAEDAMRLQINCPEKTSLGQMANFAISPDGRHLVFSAADSEGSYLVWIRSLNSLEARPLPGTEGDRSSQLFWSPDSRSIGFQSGKKLKKLDIAGGAPETICDLSGVALGGSWNRDGVIIFGNLLAGTGNVIMRVSATGGKASPLTKLNSERQEATHHSPTFLPDGRHFVYCCSSVNLENAGVYAGSLDASPEKQLAKKLMKSSSAAAYVPSGNSAPGHLLFPREQILMAQPFDEKRLETIGSPVPIAVQIGSYSASGFFSASSNGVLVYTSGERRLFQLTWFDRQGKPVGTEGEKGRFAGLSLSADGRRAAISFDNSPGGYPTPFIWLLDFARGSNTQLSFKGWELNPIWSPDGSRVIFTSGEGLHDLYQKPASGIKDKELVLESNANKSPTSWSNDGRFLTYATQGDLWVLSMEAGGKEMPLLQTNSNEDYGCFSPNMHWIAYVSNESGKNEVWVRGFSQTAGGVPSVTSGKWMVSRGGGTEPRWPGDGKELYYRDPDGKVMAVEITDGKEFQAGIPKVLFPTSRDASTTLATISVSSWDVAADGKRFLLPAPVLESAPPPFNVILNWTSLVKK